MAARKVPGAPILEPWKPSAWELPDAAAIQALQRGDATPEQQRHALTFIVNTLAATYDCSFRTGDDGDRVSAFAEGKRWVGLQVVKLANLSLGKFKSSPSEQG